MPTRRLFQHVVRPWALAFAVGYAILAATTVEPDPLLGAGVSAAITAAGAGAFTFYALTPSSAPAWVFALVGATPALRAAWQIVEGGTRSVAERGYAATVNALLLAALALLLGALPDEAGGGRWKSGLSARS